MFDALKRKYDQLLNPINQGLSQFARSTPQPVKSFVKPIVNEVRNVATQQIPSYQRAIPLTQMTSNPIGFMNALEMAQQAFQRLSQGAGQAVGNFAKGVQQQYTAPLQSSFSKPLYNAPQNQLIQNAANAVGKVNIARLSPLGNVFPQIRNAFPTVGDYTQNQIVKPLSLVTNQKASPIDRGIGALQGGFSVTPAGSLYNIGTGIAAGGLRSARTGMALDKSIKQAVTNPTSVATAGLGVKNPFLAMGLDVLAGNPKGAIKGLKSTKGIASALKGVNPKAFDLHPDDAAELSVIGQKILSKATLSLQENKTLERTFKYLYPGYKLDKLSNKKIGNVIAATLDRYNKIPKGEMTQFPSMGLVEGGEFKLPYKNGDISKLKKGLDDELSTVSRTDPKKSRIEELEYYAKQDNEEAQAQLDLIRNMEQNVQLATQARGNIKVRTQAQIKKEVGETNPLKQELSGYLDELSKEELYMKPIAMDIAFAKRDGVPVEKFLTRKVTNKLNEIGFLLDEDPSLAQNIRRLPKEHRDEAIRYLESNFSSLKGKFQDAQQPLSGIGKEYVPVKYELVNGKIQQVQGTGKYLDINNASSQEIKAIRDGINLEEAKAKQAQMQLFSRTPKKYINNPSSPEAINYLKKSNEAQSILQNEEGNIVNNYLNKYGFKSLNEFNSKGPSFLDNLEELALKKEGNLSHVAQAGGVDKASQALIDTAKSYGTDSVIPNDAQLKQWTINQIASGNKNVAEHLKVVQEAGKPVPISSTIGSHVAQPPIDDIKTLYHGSTEKIDKFDLNHLNTTYMHNGLGINFTDNKDFAKLYSRGKNEWGEILRVDNGKGFVNERSLKNAKSLDLTGGDKVVGDVISLDSFKKLASMGRDKEWARNNLERLVRNSFDSSVGSLEATGKARNMSDSQLLEFAYNRLKDKKMVKGEGLPDLFRQLIDVYGINPSDKAEVVRQFSKITGADYIKSTNKDGSVVYTVLNPDKLSSPSQPPVTDIAQKSFTQKGSYTNTRADQVAGKFRKTSDTPSLQPRTAEGKPLQSQQQSPVVVTRQPLQNQSNSRINSSTTSIQRTVKDDFEAEMDAQIGKTFEKPFSGKSKMKNTPTELPGDQSSADFATGRAAIGGGGVKNLPQTDRDQFQKWVNTRRATELEGYLKKKEFSDLDNKGIEGIFEFQSGNKTGRYADVKRFFDAKYKTLQDNKIQFDYRQDYLPQLWNNTKEEVNQVLGRRIGLKPSFTLDAVFKSYQEGIDAGLSPKFKNVSDLTGWYEQKANKAIADKNFFDYLGKEGTIMPSTKAPMDWVTLDPDRFPKFLSQIGDEKFAGTYKAPREIADVVNNYLQGARVPMLEKVANYVSKVKNVTLNFGIPGTAINMHGVNILARHTLMGTGGNPLTRFITGGKYMLNQHSASKELDKSLIRAPKAIKDGLMLSAEDYSGLQKVGTTLAQKFGKKWDDAFGGPLFNKMLPALKLSSYEELVKNGMGGKEAAKLVNNVYGGINWEQMGRSKDVQNMLRIAILAPDWAETTVRLGGNFAKALNPIHKSETANRYRTMMATILASYVAHNVANKLTSGHYSYENDPSNIFNIEIGYTDSGEKRFLRPYGTGLDMVRLPAEVAMGLAKGDLTGITRLVRNRLSIPAGVGVGVLTDQDYRGNSIGYRGTDKYGNEMPLSQRSVNIGSEMASLVGVPAFTRQFGRTATGQQGLEEGLTQGFELPFRYSNTGNSNVQKQVSFVADGKKGKDLYDFNQTLKGQSKFSDNQIQIIKGYDDPKQGLKDTLELRKVRSDANKAKADLTKVSGIDQADAAEETPITSKGTLNLELEKQRVKLSKKAKLVGNTIIYPTETGVSTIDLSPPTKGTGIGAFANQNWNITKAREVWNAEGITKEQKAQAFKQLGVKQEDVRYDALASYSNDIKAQYISSKSTSREKLFENILSGRKRSIGDNIFASDGVIDSLVDEGRLSKEEAKELKKIDYDKNGTLKQAKASGKKGRKPAMPKVKAIKISFAKVPKAKKFKTTKVTRVKQYKLKKVKKLTSGVKKVTRLS